MENPRVVKGRCFCSRVQFSIQEPTDFCAHCHCESCRLSHATAFVTWTSVPSHQFELETGQDNLKWYRSSEFIEWGFCSNCGSSMLYRAIKVGHPENPKLDRIYIALGSLLGPIDKMPSCHVSYEERVHWSPEDNLPKYEGKGNRLLPEGSK